MYQLEIAICLVPLMVMVIAWGMSHSRMFYFSYLENNQENFQQLSLLQKNKIFMICNIQQQNCKTANPREDQLVASTRSRRFFGHTIFSKFVNEWFNDTLKGWSCTNKPKYLDTWCLKVIICGFWKYSDFQSISRQFHLVLI